MLSSLFPCRAHGKARSRPSNQPVANHFVHVMSNNAWNSGREIYINRKASGRTVLGLLIISSYMCCHALYSSAWNICDFKRKVSCLETSFCNGAPSISITGVPYTHQAADRVQAVLEGISNQFIDSKSFFIKIGSFFVNTKEQKDQFWSPPCVVLMVQAES